MKGTRILLLDVRSHPVKSEIWSGIIIMDNRWIENQWSIIVWMLKDLLGGFYYCPLSIWHYQHMNHNSSSIDADLWMQNQVRLRIHRGSSVSKALRFRQQMQNHCHNTSWHQLPQTHIYLPFCRLCSLLLYWFTILVSQVNMPKWNVISTFLYSFICFFFF